MAEKIQKRKPMTPGALTANRANGTKGGRPSGREKIELRDRIRATPEQWGNWDEPLALAGPGSEAKSDGEDGDK
jgi:hypothetical protein